MAYLGHYHELGSYRKNNTKDVQVHLNELECREKVNFFL